MKIHSDIKNFRFAGLLTLIGIAMLKPAYPSGPDSLFQSDQLIRMELRADFVALGHDRDKIATYHDAVLVCYSPSGDTAAFNVKVMVRGNFRRDPANCNFPPLFINFRKRDVENTLFENQDKLKLVTPCHAEEDIIEEYLVYKLYNKVTDLSLKVRLVKMLYFDTSRGKEVFEKFSFFIEHDEDAAERNNAFLKDRFITPFDLDADNARKLSVFQYMVGNKDWQFTSRQNLILIQPNDTSLKSSAIPYDFDFSGFVNAHYTKPDGVPEDLLPTRRLYNGLCYSTEEFREVFDFFIKLKPDFMSLINNSEFISKSRKREKISYLNYFYKVIEDKELFQKDFLDICKTKMDYGIIE